MSASRTDTGVHAIKQIVKITSEHPIACAEMVSQLNSTLPAQIRCREFVPCSGEFRPNSDSTSKEYRYLFTNNKIATHERRFISNISLELDFDSMVTCVKSLHGTNSFHNFCSTGSNVKTTIREIKTCELSVVNPHTILSPHDLFKIPAHLEKCYQFRIEGNGFLKQMIRHIVRSLWMVGSGKLTTDDFHNLLVGPKKEKMLWKTASPSGLYLYDIKYPTTP